MEAGGLAPSGSWVSVSGPPAVADRGWPEDAALVDFGDPVFIGAGSFGAAFRAIERPVGRPVIVKITHRPEDAGVLRVEAAALGRLDHPAIVRLLRFGRLASGRGFYVTPDIAAVTLAAWLGDASMRARWRVAADLGAGLVALHAAGLAHGDVSLLNAVVASGDPPRACWIDLGLCSGRAEARARDVARFAEVLDVLGAGDGLLAAAARVTRANPEALQRVVAAIEARLAGRAGPLDTPFERVSFALARARWALAAALVLALSALAADQIRRRRAAWDGVALGALDNVAARLDGGADPIETAAALSAVEAWHGPDARSRALSMRLSAAGYRTRTTGGDVAGCTSAFGRILCAREGMIDLDGRPWWWGGTRVEGWLFEGPVVVARRPIDGASVLTVGLVAGTPGLMPRAPLPDPEVRGAWAWRGGWVLAGAAGVTWIDADGVARRAHSPIVSAVAFDPVRGRVFACDEGRLAAFSLISGARAQVPVQAGGCRRLWVAGDTLAMSQDDRFVLTWDLSTWPPIALPGLNVSGVIRSPASGGQDPRRLAVLRTDGVVEEWISGPLPHRVGVTSAVGAKSIVWSGADLVTSDAQRLAPGVDGWTRRVHAGEVTDVAFCGDQNSVVSVGSDAVFVRSIRDAAAVRAVPVPESQVGLNAVTCDAEGRAVVAGHGSAAMFVERESGFEELPRDALAAPIEGFAWSPARDTLYIAGRDEQVSAWRWPEASLRWRRGQRSGPTIVGLRADAERLVALTVHGDLLVMDPQTGATRARVEITGLPGPDGTVTRTAHADAFAGLAHLDGGGWVVGAKDGSHLLISEAMDAVEVREYAEGGRWPVAVVAVPGRRYAIGGWDGRVGVWEAASRTAWAVVNLDAGQSVNALDVWRVGDAALVVAATSGGQVRRWRIDR